MSGKGRGLGPDGGAQLKNRVSDDVDHQRGTAAELVHHHAERNAPTGRIASVMKMASAMAETLP